MYFRLLKSGVALSALVLALAAVTPAAQAQVVTTVIDTFSDADPSPPGTLVPGIFVNGGTPTATGVDTVGTGFDPIGGSRTAMLMHTAGGTTNAFTDTSTGEFFLNSPAQSSATLMLSYSPPTQDGAFDIVLASDTIEAIFSFVDVGDGATVPFQLDVNGQFVGVFDLVQGPQVASFDVSAFVGQQISSIKFTLTGNLATDVTLTQINGTFERVTPPPPPPPPPGIPEPASLALWGIAGLSGLYFAKRRRAATAR